MKFLFIVIGIDFVGFFYVKDKLGENFKVYICFFICVLIWVLYLELVLNLI